MIKREEKLNRKGERKQQSHQLRGKGRMMERRERNLSVSQRRVLKKKRR